MENFNWISYRLTPKEENDFYLLVKKNKGDLNKSFNKSINENIKMIAEVIAVIKKSENEKWDDIREIWNTIGHICYISYDFKVIVKALLNEEDNEKEKLLLRFASTHLYESMTKIVKFLGANFSKQLFNLKIDHELLEELSKIRTKFQDFKETHQNDFDRVRNTIGSHRDTDIVVFHNVLNAIEKTPIIRIIMEFDALLNESGVVVTKIMNVTAKMKTR